MTEPHAPNSTSKNSHILRTVVIVGAAGQLGTALRATAPTHINVVALSRHDLDVTNAHDVATHAALRDCDVIINCAAYTDVDAAESHPDAAFALNRDAVAYLADRAIAESAHLIHISTDYVFGDASSTDALLRRPLRPTDPAEATNVYGQSKRAGESEILARMSGQRGSTGCGATIIRTAWVWSGPTQPKVADFVSTMLRLERNTRPDGTISVVNDQHGNPTFVDDLARAVWECAVSPVAGVFHVTGSGQATWHDVAQAVFAAVGADPARVLPCDSSQFPRPAARPTWSVLDTSSWVQAGFSPLPEWRDVLRKTLS